MSAQYPSILIEPDDMLMIDVAIGVELSIYWSNVLSERIAWTIWSLSQGSIYIGILKENISIHCPSVSGPIRARQRGAICIVLTNTPSSSVASPCSYRFFIIVLKSYNIVLDVDMLYDTFC